MRICRFIFLSASLYSLSLQIVEGSSEYQACQALIADIYKRQPQVLSTERIAAFLMAFPSLTAKKTSESVEYEIDPSRLTPAELMQFTLDLRFLQKNPRLPIESSTATLTNYLPKNLSQTEAQKLAQRLVDADPLRTTSAGLFLQGSPGIGKSHLSVAVAKQFMNRGEPVLFVSPENKKTITEDQILNARVFIIDDFNSGYDGDMARLFKAIVMKVFDQGGRLFVTSNSSFERLIEECFITDSANVARLKDRIRGMMKIITLQGESHRKPSSWAE